MKMKKIKEVVSKEETNHKLKIQEIKKNSSADVSHTIKKIRAEEAKIVILMSVTMFVVLCISGYIIFSGIQDTNISDATSGPLTIIFSTNDESGMEDIINFSGKDNVLSDEYAEVFSTEFTIVNDSSSNSWYGIYLDDYLDMIEYDGCMDKSFDKNLIYFSIDNSETKSLASVYDDGRYVLMQGIIHSNDEVVHSLQVWYSGSSDSHYHGKVNVEYIR